MPHTAKLLSRNRGRTKARYAWSTPGGAKARQLVFRQGGAADRLFRVSFAGTSLGGGGRARKKPERYRGPCGESGARDRLLVRGITGVRRPRLVAIGLSLEFALSVLRPAERGRSGPTLTTRTYSYPNWPLHGTAYHASELRFSCSA